MIRGGTDQADPRPRAMSREWPALKDAARATAPCIAGAIHRTLAESRLRRRCSSISTRVHACSRRLSIGGRPTKLPGAVPAAVPYVLAVVIALAARPAASHTFGFTDVTLAVDGGAFRIGVVCDLDALALGVDAAASDSASLAAEIEAMTPAAREGLVAGLIQTLQRRLRVRIDDQPVLFAVALPDRGRGGPAGGVPSALGLVARLEGRVPADAKTISFFASRAFPPVRLTVVAQGQPPRLVEVLERGGTSRPLPLREAAASPGGPSVAGRFLRLGFTHIVPEGLDHVLFVLGLALLSPRLGPLLAQVTAFTLAHTLTLALAVYGIASLPARVVEPLITASIVFVTVENLFRREASWARLAVVFGFGLLHGLGFAGALSELGWPTGRRLLALLSFNLGVELGQLAVIGVALLLLTALERVGAPRGRLERVISAVVAVAGAVWTAQRVL